MKYVVYDKDVNILRSVRCSPALAKKQAKDDEFVMEGEADDATQKIEFDGFDTKGQPINPRIVDKTPGEIEADNPPPPLKIPKNKRPAVITNEQWQDVLNRLRKLETEA